jgi:hypothetical protein
LPATLDNSAGVFRQNSKRYDLRNGRLSDNAALIASINGPSFGGCASISTLPSLFQRIPDGLSGLRQVAANK